jgi:hypothetical protein
MKQSAAHVKIIYLYLKKMQKMAKRKRLLHDIVFKTKVVLEALKEQKTLAQLSSELGVRANQISV